MNWIKEHINNIELFLFCLAGSWNVVHGVVNSNSLQMQVGFLFYCVGFLDCLRSGDR